MEIFKVNLFAFRQYCLYCRLRAALFGKKFVSFAKRLVFLYVNLPKFFFGQFKSFAQFNGNLLLLEKNKFVVLHVFLSVNF
jgi:hypothetical protein